MTGNIAIVGALSAFGALAVALFLVSGGASLAGLTALALNTQFAANAIILIVIAGAVLSMAARFN